MLTRDALADLVPIEPASMVNRQIIEWDKDDIDLLKFMKVDVLGLGMLGCLRRAFDLIEEHRGATLDLFTIPQDDTATYAMIQPRRHARHLPDREPGPDVDAAADEARKLYDLTIQVAIVRPGPIQGDMVHPYLRRREGQGEAGLPEARAATRAQVRRSACRLFQEQAMQVAIQCAGFTPRRGGPAPPGSMATFKLTGGVHSTSRTS